MTRVSDILDDVLALLKQRVSRRCSSDGRSMSTVLFLQPAAGLCCQRTVAIPGFYTVSQDAPYSASIEVDQQLLGDVIYSKKISREKESCLSRIACQRDC